MSEETKETVEIEISNNTFMEIALLAHEKDITFNEICERILQSYMNEN